MEERLRFVARVLDGEAMTDVCRDFGISPKTGYKISMAGSFQATGVSIVNRECPDSLAIVIIA
jgi:hypothetical protein